MFSYETAKDIKKRRSAGQRLKVTFRQFRRSASTEADSAQVSTSPNIKEVINDRDKILREDNQITKTTFLMSCFLLWLMNGKNKENVLSKISIFLYVHKHIPLT